MIWRSGGGRVCTTFGVTAEALREAEAELVEQLLLISIGPAHAAEPQGAAVGGVEEDVAALDAAEPMQGVLGRERGPGALEGVLERDPEGVAEEGDEDVGLHASGFLMPEGANGEFALEGPERRFDFGELHVLGPQGGGVGMREIGAQQVGARAGGMPGALLGALLPEQAALARAARDRDLVAAGDGP